jgi:tetratricopeptide (TPR) repeat protein
MACHMPRALSSDIAHTAVTDHRIRRKPAAPRPPGPSPPLEPGEAPIAHFHQELLDPLDPGAERDLGLALVHVSRELPSAAPFLVPLAEPRLEAAVKANPDDVSSREGLAFLPRALGRSDLALARYEKLLAEFPRRESTLFEATYLANQAGQAEAALRYARRLVEVNSREPAYHQQLAIALAVRGE